MPVGLERRRCASSFSFGVDFFWDSFNSNCCFWAFLSHSQDEDTVKGLSRVFAEMSEGFVDMIAAGGSPLSHGWGKI